MVEELCLWASQTTEIENHSWEKVKASGKINVQVRLELDKNCSIDVELAKSGKVVDE